ncbi:hypothetical protein J6590_058235 [Homalodisca vitripennis]|nr:hypothetical protein J6590_058235 [Homalodisca vitripennis]
MQSQVHERETCLYSYTARREGGMANHCVSDTETDIDNDTGRSARHESSSLRTLAKSSSRTRGLPVLVYCEARGRHGPIIAAARKFKSPHTCKVKFTNERLACTHILRGEREAWTNHCVSDTETDIDSDTGRSARQESSRLHTHANSSSRTSTDHFHFSSAPRTRDGILNNRHQHRTTASRTLNLGWSAKCVTCSFLSAFLLSTSFPRGPSDAAIPPSAPPAALDRIIRTP